ncbi:MAG: transposase [Anaerolineae bacterium]|nr:transposase [Anaerolineae bacterium]
MGHFELRSVYNFRQRVAAHMQSTGENLIAQAFEPVTDAQISAFKLRTDKLRMDSTLIASNIRETTRLQLLVEVLQRVQRMLTEADQQRYAAAFAPYLKGTSGQYIYALKRTAYAEHRQQVGALMQQLVTELQPQYADAPAYQVLARVFREHFVSDAQSLRAKEGSELSASSLQSPDDWEATYRRKRDVESQGYVANVTDTCHPDNDFQLIVKLQTAANTTDDAVLLAEALPDLVQRTGVNEMHSDGGYNSPEADQVLHQQRVQLVQTAIRGRQPTTEELGLADFTWHLAAEDDQPQQVTCPHGQQVAVTPGRKARRYRAAFAAAVCAQCPLRAQCPTQPLKRRPEYVLRFSQHDLHVALRRQRCADERASSQHLRPAVEATVRAVKHPFGNGKVPVRGKARVSMLLIGSAAMYNVRQIHRHQVSQKTANKGPKDSQTAVGSAFRQPLASFLASLWNYLLVSLCSIHPLRPISGYSS